MRHHWESDRCTTCKLARGKTDSGTAWYRRDEKSAKMWQPGPCVEPARLDADATAKPKTILTAPVVQAKRDGGTNWHGPAETIIETATGKRTSLHAKPVIVTCTQCGTKARFGQDLSGWTAENVCDTCQEPEVAAARTIRVQLVPITRTDLMCVVCGCFRTELGISHTGEGDMQSGLHRACIDAVHVKRGS
jgi:hypothetical protein